MTTFEELTKVGTGDPLTDSLLSLTGTIIGAMNSQDRAILEVLEQLVERFGELHARIAQLEEMLNVHAHDADGNMTLPGDPL